MADGSPQTCVAAATHLGVRDLAAFLRECCNTAGVDEMSVFDLELAMVEAANNIVEHGYEETGGGVIRLAVEIARGEVALLLEDEGRPAPADLFALCRTAPLDATEGRGLGIVRSCVDLADYSRAGSVNRLRLVKTLTA
ncbi:ATP-binding protein [Parablastomonas sp. CN1-191]|uniref:ATP-binding protein n=1 Tax=Parablastomonas sp. CN1-191 TaxID=3400908 RepID=UPI003BF79DE8